MRSLADELGVVPMALYKHVRDKEDLVNAMVDAVIAEFGRPDPTAMPAQDAEALRSAMHRALLAARAAVLRHPWARRAIETRTTRTVSVLDHMESVTQLFLRRGFSPDLAHHAMHTLGNRIWGFSPELFSEPVGSGSPSPQPTGTSTPAQRDRRQVSPTPDPADYPAILAIAADAARRRPGATSCDEDFEFGFALDVMLDGLEQAHASRWSSGPVG